MAQSPVTMPALGRPFSLGMLYDCRSDQLVPGMTLWDPALLQSDVRKTVQPATDLEIIMEDSLESKSRALNVEAELKLSALCGLCKVSGAAKYLNDRCSSLRQSRVSLQFKSTARFEQLTMTQLGRGNTQHPHVFDDDIATHVVTGIVYGADAFMVFDHMANSAEETMQVKGHLKAELDKVLAKALELGGGAELSYKNNKKDVRSKTKCTFYSDFSSLENPTTFEDAVALYKKLPTLCGLNGEKTVPKIVYLYPLSKLGGGCQQIVRGISEFVVDQTIEALESMHRIRMAIGDLLSKPDETEGTLGNAAVKFVRLKKEIQNIMHAVTQYELSIRRQVMPLLPKIRGGVSEEEQLRSILATHQLSPMCESMLSNWVEKKNREIKLLNGYIKIFSDSTIPICANDSELDGFIHDLSTKMVLALEFSGKAMQDPQENTLASYVASPGTTQNEDMTYWFENGKHLQQIRTHVGEFTTACDQVQKLQRNKSQTKVTFVVCTSSNHADISRMILYREGISEDFERPARPTAVQCTETGTDFVTLAWQKEAQSLKSCQYQIIKFKSQCENTINDDDDDVDSGDNALPWTEVKVAPDVRIKSITGLIANTSYQFVVTALSQIGFTVDSEILGPVRTNQKATPPVVHLVPCDACGSKEIEGTCFRCFTCYTYHLCQKCMVNGHHSEHDFVAIRQPMPMEGKLLFDLKNVYIEALPVLRWAEDTKKLRVSHPGQDCDVCGFRGIRGTCYTCVACDNYDMCEKCVVGKTHRDHDLIAIRKPLHMDDVFQSQKTRLSIAADIRIALQTQTLKLLLNTPTGDASTKSTNSDYGNRACNACGGTIKGNRFACLVCCGYELCKDCMVYGKHYAHDFLVIRSPMPANVFDRIVVEARQIYSAALPDSDEDQWKNRPRSTQIIPVRAFSGLDFL